ncbi:MAG: ADP-ribosylation/crystallin J1 [Sphingobacteriales bacterium]|nr:MAG: ADP-ribosylation/crystallin J1 [Sphingobacteriales bacterium]
MKTLYRPVGTKELELIAALDWKAFPPRLDWQPIFYPVLNQPYAEQIAKDWNTVDEASGYCGIVTRFYIDDAHFECYTVENVGAAMHNELWVPAEQLEVFNRNIVGDIEVLNVFFGTQFIMPESPLIRKVLNQFLQ